MEEFIKRYPPDNMSISGLLVLGGLLLLGGVLLHKILKSLPENPSEEEIEEAVSDIPGEEQQENAKVLLFDPYMRAKLKELTEPKEKAS